MQHRSSAPDGTKLGSEWPAAIHTEPTHVTADLKVRIPPNFVTFRKVKDLFQGRGSEYQGILLQTAQT
jgi:hypothetical protein